MWPITTTQALNPPLFVFVSYFGLVLEILLDAHHEALAQNTAQRNIVALVASKNLLKQQTHPL